MLPEMEQNLAQSPVSVCSVTLTQAKRKENVAQLGKKTCRNEIKMKKMQIYFH